MVTVGIVNVRSGRSAARTRGAARDIFAAIRHARSTALVTMQPAVVTYSCVMEDDEPVAKIEIHSARILNVESDSGIVQTLSGEPVENGEKAGPAKGGEKAGPDVAEEKQGETLEDILFAPISAEIVKGMRLKVAMGDDDAGLDGAGQKKPKVSVFSNVDYLIGKFRDSRRPEKQKEPSADADAGKDAQPADQDLQKEVSVAWETNGRTDPHRLWIYPDGSVPEKGLLIKVDRFGGVKVLPGDGREDEE
jgi:hypothetical protein